MSTRIRLRSVTKSYTRGGIPLTVLEDLSLDAEPESFVALMGPSGSGKSTLLNLLGALDQPDSGSILVGDVEISSLAASALPAWRARNVGFVFQSFNLISVLTAFENVLLPLKLTPLSRADQKAHAAFALEVVGLQDRMHHRPSQLSGGQEQRVAIARAISTDPALVLADEPTGDLDRRTADEIMELLRRLNTELHKTIFMVTHDTRAAEQAKTVLHLDKGRLDRTTPNDGDAEKRKPT
ncbi:MAG: ABC transporter ATP-binding protein [Planctomycetota bacterium]